ncbi:MAG: hypothetical protein LC776_03810 [Acidobacteria bacterium]|nr:hypothetical protein [Acidobacteriota bacterium]
MSSLPPNQRMARVTVSEELWCEFRALALRKKRSVATYLGHLVAKEIGRAERAEHRSRLRQSIQVAEERSAGETWIPPWEV